MPAPAHSRSPLLQFAILALTISLPLPLHGRQVIRLIEGFTVSSDNPRATLSVECAEKPELSYVDGNYRTSMADIVLLQGKTSIRLTDADSEKFWACVNIVPDANSRATATIDVKKLRSAFPDKLATGPITIRLLPNAVALSKSEWSIPNRQNEFNRIRGQFGNLTDRLNEHRVKHYTPLLKLIQQEKLEEMEQRRLREVIDTISQLHTWEVLGTPRVDDEYALVNWFASSPRTSSDKLLAKSTLLFLSERYSSNRELSQRLAALAKDLPFKADGTPEVLVSDAVWNDINLTQSRHSVNDLKQDRGLIFGEEIKKPQESYEERRLAFQAALRVKDIVATSTDAQGMRRVTYNRPVSRGVLHASENSLGTYSFEASPNALSNPLAKDVGLYVTYREYAKLADEVRQRFAGAEFSKVDILWDLEVAGDKAARLTAEGQRQNIEFLGKMRQAYSSINPVSLEHLRPDQGRTIADQIPSLIKRNPSAFKTLVVHSEHKDGETMLVFADSSTFPLKSLLSALRSMNAPGGLFVITCPPGLKIRNDEARVFVSFIAGVAKSRSVKSGDLLSYSELALDRGRAGGGGGKTPAAAGSTDPGNSAQAYFITYGQGALSSIVAYVFPLDDDDEDEEKKKKDSQN